MKPTITAIIIAKDEQEMIANCIDTLGWCDEVLVIDNGSCEYPEPGVEGCTDLVALNYNPEAIVDDGFCEYPEPPLPDIPPIDTSSSPVD